MVRYPREGHGLRRAAARRGPDGPQRGLVREALRAARDALAPRAPAPAAASYSDAHVAVEHRFAAAVAFRGRGAARGRRGGAARTRTAASGSCGTCGRCSTTRARWPPRDDEARLTARSAELPVAPGRGASTRAAAPSLVPRHQRHRRRDPHQPRPRSAARGGRRARGAGRCVVLEPGVRPRRGRARVARDARGSAAARAARRGGHGRRQQQRGRGAPGREHAWRRAARWWSAAASWSRSAARSASPTCCARAARGCARSARPTARAWPTTRRRSGPTPRSSSRCIPATSASSASPARPTLDELVALARSRSVPLVEDLGSGALGALPPRDRGADGGGEPRRPAWTW